MSSAGFPGWSSKTGSEERHGSQIHEHAYEHADLYTDRPGTNIVVVLGEIRKIINVRAALTRL